LASDEASDYECKLGWILVKFSVDMEFATIFNAYNFHTTIIDHSKIIPVKKNCNKGKLGGLQNHLFNKNLLDLCAYGKL